MDDVILTASDIAKLYTIDHKREPILTSVQLQVCRGEVVAIVGKSGSGKSTLLNILSGLDSADAGSVMVDGQDIAKLSGSKRAAWRLRHVGFVFQDHGLQSYLSVEQNILAPAIFAKQNGEAMKSRCSELMDQLGLTERRTQRATNLSGGEAQRVGIARALINSPAIVFADEPTGNLDSASADSVLQAFQQITIQNGTSVIVVTHDERVASQANRVMRLQGGLLV